MHFFENNRAIKGFKVFSSTQRLGTGTFILRSDSITHRVPMKVTERAGFNFGKGGLPMKTAISINLQIGDTVVAFLNCHLPSGWLEKDAIQRALRVEQINKVFELHKTDLVFWAGDFNFRSFYDEKIFDKKESPEVANKHVADVNDSPVKENRLYTLEEVMKNREEIIKNDELSKFNFNKIASAYGFHHAKLPQYPSYRIAKESVNGVPYYNTHRKVSFTDRIFDYVNSHSAREGCSIEIENDQYYDEFIGLAVSDHL